MFLEGFEFNREESDSPESLLKEEKPPPIQVPIKNFFGFFLSSLAHFIFKYFEKKIRGKLSCLI
jgi:hypothetical protein